MHRGAFTGIPGTRLRRNVSDVSLSYYADDAVRTLIQNGLASPVKRLAETPLTGRRSATPRLGEASTPRRDDSDSGDDAAKEEDAWTEFLATNDSKEEEKKTDEDAWAAVLAMNDSKEEEEEEEEEEEDPDEDVWTAVLAKNEDEEISRSDEQSCPPTTARDSVQSIRSRSASPVRISDVQPVAVRPVVLRRISSTDQQLVETTQYNILDRGDAFSVTPGSFPFFVPSVSPVDGTGGTSALLPVHLGATRTLFASSPVDTKGMFDASFVPPETLLPVLRFEDDAQLHTVLADVYRVLRMPEPPLVYVRMVFREMCKLLDVIYAEGNTLLDFVSAQRESWNAMHDRMRQLTAHVHTYRHELAQYELAMRSGMRVMVSAPVAPGTDWKMHMRMHQAVPGAIAPYTHTVPSEPYVFSVQGFFWPLPVGAAPLVVAPLATASVPFWAMDGVVFAMIYSRLAELVGVASEIDVLTHMRGVLSRVGLPAHTTDLSPFTTPREQAREYHHYHPRMFTTLSRVITPRMQTPRMQTPLITSVNVSALADSLARTAFNSGVRPRAFASPDEVCAFLTELSSTRMGSTQCTRVHIPALSVHRINCRCAGEPRPSRSPGFLFGGVDLIPAADLPHTVRSSVTSGYTFESTEHHAIGVSPQADAVAGLDMVAMVGACASTPFVNPWFVCSGCRHVCLAVVRAERIVVVTETRCVESLIDLECYDLGPLSGPIVPQKRLQMNFPAVLSTDSISKQARGIMAAQNASDHRKNKDTAEYLRNLLAMQYRATDNVFRAMATDACQNGTSATSSSVVMPRLSVNHSELSLGRRFVGLFAYRHYFASLADESLPAIPPSHAMHIDGPSKQITSTAKEVCMADLGATPFWSGLLLSKLLETL